MPFPKANIQESTSTVKLTFPHMQGDNDEI